MSNIMKVACGWRRQEQRHVHGCGLDTFSVKYVPENIAVKYRENEEGQPVVENVLIFSSEANPCMRELVDKLTDIPAEMYRTVAQLVQDNESSYGRFIHSVILPGGDIAHA
ncbi:MAG: hypothetical protein JXR78_07000 [Victivallales bacterium]|nr:hypothetical protein [Victivallales bacterium]